MQATNCFIFLANSKCHRRHTQSPRDYGASISIAAGKCNYGNSSRYDTVKKKLAPWSSFWFLFIVVTKNTHIFLKCVLTLIPEKLWQYSQAPYWLLNVPLIYMCTKYASVSGGYIYIILRDLSVNATFVRRHFRDWGILQNHSVWRKNVLPKILHFLAVSCSVEFGATPDVQAVLLSSRDDAWTEMFYLASKQDFKTNRKNPWLQMQQSNVVSSCGIYLQRGYLEAQYVLCGSGAQDPTMHSPRFCHLGWSGYLGVTQLTAITSRHT